MEGNFEHARTPQGPEQSWEHKLRKAKEYMYKKIGPGLNFAAYQDHVWRRVSYGEIDEARGATHPDILYDIASMTKFITALQILERVSAGEISLDDRVGDYLDFLQESPLQIKDLLAHRGSQVLTREKYRPGTAYLRSDLRRIFENGANLSVDRADDYNYGDLGYLHLGMVLEQVGGENLDRQTSAFVTRYALGDMMYNPIAKGVEMDQVARSERTNLPGEVQDEKAKWYGGVSGHAGLFATQKSLETLVERLFAREFELDTNLYTQLYTPQFAPSPRTGMSFSIAGIRRGLYSSYPNISGFGGSSVFLNPERHTAIVHTCNITYPERHRTREKFREWNRSVGTLLA